MKFRTTLLSMLISGLVTTVGAVTNVAAQSRCDNPQDSVDARACAKAKEGPTALRRFIDRTRMIYGLYFFDYAPRNGAWADVDRSLPAPDSVPIIQARVNDKK